MNFGEAFIQYADICMENEELRDRIEQLERAVLWLQQKAKVDDADLVDVYPLKSYLGLTNEESMRVSAN